MKPQILYNISKNIFYNKNNIYYFVIEESLWEPPLHLSLPFEFISKSKPTHQASSYLPVKIIDPSVGNSL
jgi:hypothetical protein